MSTITMYWTEIAAKKIADMFLNNDINWKEQELVEKIHEIIKSEKSTYDLGIIGTCNRCGTSIYKKDGLVEENVDNKILKYHPICRVAQRAETAERLIDILKKRNNSQESSS